MLGVFKTRTHKGFYQKEVLKINFSPLQHPLLGLAQTMHPKLHQPALRKKGVVVLHNSEIRVIVMQDEVPDENETVSKHKSTDGGIPTWL